MRALVTGGSGFIGSNIVDALVARGDEVTVIDDLTTGRRQNLDGALAAGAQLAEVDVRDRGAVGDVFASAVPEVVFHLAAQIDVRRSSESPMTDMQINVGGTINVLEAARGVGARRVINSSTGGAIYGEGKMIPAREDHPIAPEAPYGLSKYCAEQYCALFRRMHGLSTVSLRYGNVYGPRQDPLGEAGVIAIFCGLALDGGSPTVFGDGLQTRDYVYVGDIVAANLAAAGASVGGEINIGTGVEASVLDLVAALGEHADGSFEAQHAPERPGEVRHIALDATHALAELDWRPQTSLGEGLALTLDSLRTPA